MKMNVIIIYIITFISVLEFCNGAYIPNKTEENIEYLKLTSTSVQLREEGQGSCYTSYVCESCVTKPQCLYCAEKRICMSIFSERSDCGTIYSIPFECRYGELMSRIYYIVVPIFVITLLLKLAFLYCLWKRKKQTAERARSQARQLAASSSGGNVQNTQKEQKNSAIPSVKYVDGKSNPYVKI